MNPEVVDALYVTVRSAVAEIVRLAAELDPDYNSEEEREAARDELYRLAKEWFDEGLEDTR